MTLEPQTTPFIVKQNRSLKSSAWDGLAYTINALDGLRKRWIDSTNFSLCNLSVQENTTQSVTGLVPRIEKGEPTKLALSWHNSSVVLQQRAP